MIIRNDTTNKTATRSPLNNRGVRSTPGCQPAPASTLEGSPSRNDGALFQSACSTLVCGPGVLVTLVPSVTKAMTALRSLWWYVCG